MAEFSPSDPPAPGRICIVTGEFAGPDFNGGIGTTNRALALILRAHGYAVDVLYTRVNDGTPFSAKGTFDEHVSAYGKLGIKLLCIPHLGRWNDWQAKSHLAMQHLLHHQYELVFFDDTHGNAYYPLLARRTGNPALQQTKMCVTTHSATQWIYDLNKTPISTFAEVRLMEMERRSIELADAVKAPSRYILEKYRSYGWQVPADSTVLPNFVATERQAAPPVARKEIEEIVFFGRLETRKGLWMFCRALDQLKFALAGRRVTFLGKGTVENGLSTAAEVVSRSAAWPFEIRLLTQFDRDQALSYLKGGKRLAVIPSPEDNSPSAILECLAEGIPFVACSGSGGAELVSEEMRDEILFAPNAHALSQKLTEALDRGMVTGAHAVSHEALDAAFDSWISALLRSPMSAASSSKQTTLPVLFVLVPQDQQPEQAAAELARTFKSLGGRVQVEVLSFHPSEIRDRLREADHLVSFNVSHIGEFTNVAKAYAHRERSILVLCRLGQIPQIGLIERASEALQHTNVAAVTAMVETAHVPHPDPEPYFSSTYDGHSASRYLMGDAEALFPLVQETNAGFAFVRSEVFSRLNDITPLDISYGRLKSMEHWIHELLLRLRALGERFELIPDLLAAPIVKEQPFEVFRIGSLMRSLSENWFRYRPGSDQALLSRLSIDTGLRHERFRAVSDYIARAAERSGVSFDPASPAAQEDLRRLAAFAHANGQIELAVDLSIAAGTGDKKWRGLNASEFVHQALNTVRLMDAVRANAYRTLNIDNELFRIWPENSEIEMHANPANKGIAALIFPSIDLAKISRFSCTISVTMKEANPLRFRFELASIDKKQQWPTERVLRGGETAQWEIEIPKAQRTKCKLLLGVELADADDSSAAAFARWVNPQFFQSRELPRP